VTHAEFLTLRESLRASRPSLVDCAELNVYRSLALPPLEPSIDPQARYRCHVAERFLAHLGLPESLKPRAQVSHGVRRSLRALFGVLATRGARVGVPCDVYPVYLQLAADAGVTVVPFEARRGLPDLERVDAVVLCEPLKPWGVTLSDEQARLVETWALEDAARLVMIDSAYATPPTASTRRLLEQGAAALLCSLSKGWLLPDHVGLCVTPPAWQPVAREAFGALEKAEARLRIGFAALTEHPHRPLEVARLLAARAARLDAFTRERADVLASPCVGYFAVSPRSFDELLAMGVLAVPASVFGQATGTVLSSLAPAA
jgi:histidinol-phosphate/aromatic aminotransferase/cobyric acid decarboxylase-like protein